MGEEGLQARGAYKGWPRPSRRLALAAPKSSRDVAEQGTKRSLTLPPPWLGLAPSPYPNRLTMYKKNEQRRSFACTWETGKRDPLIKPAKQPR